VFDPRRIFFFFLNVFIGIGIWVLLEAMKIYDKRKGHQLVGARSLQL
jgi:hypothetical protein